MSSKELFLIKLGADIKSLENWIDQNYDDLNQTCLDFKDEYIDGKEPSKADVREMDILLALKHTYAIFSDAFHQYLGEYVDPDYDE